MVAGEEGESEAEGEVEIDGVVGGELMGAGGLGEGGRGSGGRLGDEIDVKFVDQLEKLQGLGFGENLAAFADEDGVGHFESPEPGGDERGRMEQLGAGWGGIFFEEPGEGGAGVDYDFTGQWRPSLMSARIWASEALGNFWRSLSRSARMALWGRRGRGILMRDEVDVGFAAFGEGDGLAGAFDTLGDFGEVGLRFEEADFFHG